MPSGKSPVHSDAARDIAVKAIAISNSLLANKTVKRAQPKNSRPEAQAPLTDTSVLGCVSKGSRLI